jgi:hypothetical protein
MAVKKKERETVFPIPHDPDPQKDIEKAVNKVLEKKDKQAQLQARKMQKQEELRVTELDVKRTFQAGNQLFTNACDYLKKVILPVHKDHPLLKEHNKALALWIEVLEKWSAGIGVGHVVDWEGVDSKIESIKKMTQDLNKTEQKFKDDKIDPLIEEVKKVNKEISDTK